MTYQKIYSPKYGILYRHPARVPETNPVVEKIEKMYWSIGEVAERFNEPDFTIRFWSDLFPMPLKRNKRGRRYYSRENLESLSILYDLLRVRKFTIEGAKLELEKRGLLDGKHFLKV